MVRSAQSKLLRLFLGAALVFAGWFFLNNVERIAAQLFGCSYQEAAGRLGKPETCLGVSTPKRQATDAVGIVLVFGGILLVVGSLDQKSRV
ncbi:MAG TPA: hypothetical protein VGR47_04885 [Terracidiphilus sp.]|nr:hypothetical protein [Terracidiphilus sp.]